jgi:hypothetical protein
LPTKTTSYRTWAARLTDYAQNPAIKARWRVGDIDRITCHAIADPKY